MARGASSASLACRRQPGAWVSLALALRRIARGHATAFNTDLQPSSSVRSCRASVQNGSLTKDILRNMPRLSYYSATLESASLDMALYQSEQRSKVRRDKSREAISLAMESRWQEAADTNRSIIELFPEDIEASNRLSKALLELGDYPQARAAFSRSLELSPSNIHCQEEPRAA